MLGDLILQNRKYVLALGSIALAVSGCQLSNSANDLDSLEGNPSEYWTYQNCEERTVEPVEVVPSESPKRLRRVVTISANDALSLDFYDENGQQYSLEAANPASKDEHRTIWKGEARLAYAVEGIDVDPLVIAYEVVNLPDGSKNEIIYTKGIIPEVYHEPDVKKAYEVNRYSNGEALMAVLMQKDTDGSSHDYIIERACGNAFGYNSQVHRKEVPRGEFAIEIGL